MKKRYIVLLCVVAVLILVRLSLPFFLTHYLNQALNQEPAYRGSIEGVGLSLLRGTYSVDKIRIEKREGKTAYPFVSVEHAAVKVSWAELLRLHLVADVHIQGLNVNILAEKAPPKEKAKPTDWQKTLRRLIPAKIALLTIEGDSLHFRDENKKPEIDVYLDRLRVEARNLTNSRKVAESLFGTIDVSARAMQSGQLDIHTLINPTATPLEFKTTVKLEKLDLVEMNRFFRAYGKFDVKKGHFNLYSEVAVADNAIKGYAKPLVHDLEVADFSEDAQEGVLHAFWQQIVDFVAGVFKNRPKDRQAARIPFSGRLDDPNVDIWATLGSILKNMFLAPISPRVENSVELRDVKK